MVIDTAGPSAAGVKRVSALPVVKPCARSTDGISSGRGWPPRSWVLLFNQPAKADTATNIRFSSRIVNRSRTVWSGSLPGSSFPIDHRSGQRGNSGDACNIAY